MKRKSPQSFTDSFKRDAVRQIVERGYSIPDVAQRLGIGKNNLYRWVKLFGPEFKNPKIETETHTSQEVARLKAELKRVTEERDILKKAAAFFASQSQ